MAELVFPSFTIISCFVVIYESVKLTFFFLSSVTVKPDAPISTFPDEIAAMMESNAISSICISMPSSSHTACMISISIPVILLSS